MKHAQGTLSTGFVVNCCSVMAQPFRPNSSRTKKIHRRSLFCGVDCKQRSPQPKDPFLDGKDGKGLNDSYIRGAVKKNCFFFTFSQKTETPLPLF